MKTHPSIQEVAIKTIKPNPDNPRIIRDENYEKLLNSVREFPKMLWLRPIVVNSLNIVLGGNMRLRACQEAGMKKIPIIYADDLTPEEQREFIIKDNVSFGEWDHDQLAQEWDVDQIEKWGVELPEFQSGIKEAKEDNFEIDEGTPTDIVLGDLFEIGKHRLLCGDSTSKKQVQTLMAGKKASLLFTDPPYGVSYTGAQNDTAKKWEMIKNDDLRGDGLVKFLFLALQNAYASMEQDTAAYIWYASKTHMQFETALQAAGFEVNQQLIWNKGMSLGHADYHWAHEPVLYCKKQGQTKPWYGDRTHKTVLGDKRHELANLKKEDLVQIIKNLEDTSSVWDIDRETVTTYKHPTQKPVPLAGRGILNSSQDGEIVLDLFAGSGTTMVACQQLERIGYVMELDPKFCQVIVDRMIHNFPNLPIKKNGKKYTPSHAKESSTS